MNIKCECGGTLRRAKLERFDFSALAGLPVDLRGASGLRCDTCGGETLDGKVINRTLERLTAEVLMLPRILSPAEAKYLRKHLGLSPKALAERMFLQRETVVAWERGQEPLSPQSDYILRGLVIGSRRPAEPMPADLLTRALGHVRAPAKPSPIPEPFIIAKPPRPQPGRA